MLGALHSASPILPMGSNLTLLNYKAVNQDFVIFPVKVKSRICFCLIIFCLIGCAISLCPLLPPFPTSTKRSFVLAVTGMVSSSEISPIPISLHGPFLSHCLFGCSCFEGFLLSPLEWFSSLYLSRLYPLRRGLLRCVLICHLLDIESLCLRFYLDFIVP